MAFPWKTAGIVGGGALLLLLAFSGESHAAPAPGPNPKPNPKPGPKPDPWPPGTTVGIVNVKGFPGINTRKEPSPKAPFVAHNDSFNGSRIGILETGIAE